MKQHIVSLPHHPKRVITISLIIALAIGVFGYIEINKKTPVLTIKGSPDSNLNEAGNSSFSQDLTLGFLAGGRIKSVSVKIGDKVKAGTVLASLDSENALGAVNQAMAAYSSAQISYNKLVNGASTPDIEVAKVALNNAKNTYNTTVAQQKVLVANALSAMLNSGLVALPATSQNIAITPTISGTYTGIEEGTYTIVGSANSFSVSGLENGPNGPINIISTPLGTRGLYIKFPVTYTLIDTTWTVSIPNTQSATYLTYYNAYQAALQNQTQAITVVQSAVDSAQATLDQKLAGARSEDLAIAKAQIESMQGALQIAQGAYNNTLIKAPVDGTIINVTITAGQIAIPNAPAIEFMGLTN